MLRNIGLFVAGAAIGTLVTAIFMQRKIDELEEMYNDRITTLLDAKEFVTSENEESQVSIFDKPPLEEIVAGYESTDHFPIPPLVPQLTTYENGFEPKLIPFTDYTELETYPPMDGMTKVPGPMVISGEMFNEYEDEMWGTSTLYWFDNGKVTDDLDDEIIGAGQLLGNLPAEYFQTDSGDVMYVRNHEVRFDFEVIRERKPYDQAMREKQAQLERVRADHENRQSN